LAENLPILRRTTPASIKRLAADDAFKRSLKAAAITSEMRAAQDEMAEQLYLKPAIDACAAMNFVLPLSLAVVYDSINHGGWERIRDLTGGDLPERQSLSARRGGKPQEAAEAIEKTWITAYVRKRDAWLASVKRLAATRYRTRFFLNQIAISNWELRLPVRVQGVRLTDALVTNSAVEPAIKTQDETVETTGSSPQDPPIPSKSTCPVIRAAADGPLTSAQPPDHSGDVLPPRPSGTPPIQERSCLEGIEEKVNAAVAKYDRIEGLVESVIVRKDAAKSLWTTVVGTLSQAVWAIFGLLAGVPREVWFVVAVIAGCLMLGYLYRQIALGKIREMK
jgi:hypothetical protein